MADIVANDFGHPQKAAQFGERALVPLGEARLGRIGLDEWLRRSQAAA